MMALAMARLKIQSSSIATSGYALVGAIAGVILADSRLFGHGYQRMDSAIALIVLTIGFVFLCELLNQAVFEMRSSIIWMSVAGFLLLSLALTAGYFVDFSQLSSGARTLPLREAHPQIALLWCLLAIWFVTSAILGGWRRKLKG